MTRPLPGPTPASRACGRGASPPWAGGAITTPLHQLHVEWHSMVAHARAPRRLDVRRSVVRHVGRKNRSPHRRGRRAATSVRCAAIPQVIGYYSDNELGWWNAILWKMTLEQPATSGQRQRLVQLVRELYADDWYALVRDFEPRTQRIGKNSIAPACCGCGPAATASAPCDDFLALVADRYYQLMRDTIRKFDPDALYLGDRYQSFYYPEVVAASRPYVDVVSTNFNASWNDGTFTRSYLDTLHALTGKPVMVSEFYMAARGESQRQQECGRRFSRWWRRRQERCGRIVEHASFPGATTVRRRRRLVSILR